MLQIPQTIHEKLYLLPSFRDFALSSNLFQAEATSLYFALLLYFESKFSSNKQNFRKQYLLIGANKTYKAVESK